MNPKYKNRTFYHTLTYLCNWKCEYCDFPNKEKNSLIEDNLLKYIQILKKYKNFIKNIEFELEGGEIGLIKKELLDIIFNLDFIESFQIDTNGLFIEKYYDDYKQKIHYIIYHCIDNFISADQNFKIYNISNIDYTVVITKQNYKEFPKLVKIYKNLIWTPHFLQPRIEENKDKFLNYKDFYWLYENLKNLDNVSLHIKERLKLLSNKEIFNVTLKKHQKICPLIYNAPLIDLVKMRIYRCCISASGEYVELNEKNYFKLIKNDISLFSKQEEMCNYCYNHNCVMLNKEWKKLIF